MIRRAVRVLDQRSGAAPFLGKALRYVFPDNWSFLLGEVALYAFIVLVATGIYLTFFFEPSTAQVVYHGSYGPLKGMRMSEAYRSAVDLSFNVRAGLLMRQTHHWAADVFMVAIVIHLVRVFFTGAYRKPRELTYLIGLLMLFIALPEGYLGYSMVDDLLSGMGLAIGYAVGLSIPVIGPNLTLILFGHPYPGDPSFWSRMYILHVLILPLMIGGLLAAHLALVASRHHTQFRAPKGAKGATARRSERRVIGLPTFPSQVPRSLGLFFSVAAVLFLLGGLVQINPIWLWGPYHVADSTNAAQPDWYLGWLIGAMRLIPGFDTVIGKSTVVPNPFWGGALFPMVVLLVLAAWPWAERRITGDHAAHNLLDRPRDNPLRTAFGAAFLTWVVLIFMAGSADRAYEAFGLDYVAQVWFYRIAAVILPLSAFFLTRRVCRDLQEADRTDEIEEEAEDEARGGGGPAPGTATAR